MENLEITVGELSHLGKKTYRIIDVRDEMAYSFGHIPEAVSVPIEKLESWEPEDAGKKLVVCCQKGELSLEAVAMLRERGLDAVSLQGGYLGWIMESMQEDKPQYVDAEESLRKKFRKSIW